METSQRVSESANQQIDESLLDEIEQKTVRLLQGAAQIAKRKPQITSIAQDIRRKLEALLQLPTLRERFPLLRSRKYKWATDYLIAGLDAPAAWPTLLGWLFTHALGKVVDTANFERTSHAWIDEWLLGDTIARTLQEMGLDEGAAWRAVAAIKLLTGHQRWFEIETPKTKRASRALRAWLDDDEVQRFLQVNRYQDILWFSSEAFDQLLWGMFAVAAVTISADPSRTADEVAQEIIACYDVGRALQRAEEESGYRLEKLLETA
jgi:hypothetical protein